MKRLVGTSVVFVLLLSTQGVAQPFGGPGPGPGPRLLRCIMWADEIGLSKEQRGAIEAIMAEAREEGLRLRQEGAEIRQAFLKAFSDPKVKPEQLRELEKVAREHREAVAKHRFETLMKVRSLLTPEQLKKVPEAAEKCAPHPGFRGGRP